MKKDNHQINVVRVSEVLPHGNADNLELIWIGCYQVVVRKGQFKSGDLAVYIQPDSVVPQTEPFRFIWEPYATPAPGETALLQVSERRRRITVRKFRKAWSEGLLLSIKDFVVKNDDGSFTMPLWNEGDDVSDIIGITHYDPDTAMERTKGENERGPGCRRWPRSFKGWFYFILHKLHILRKPESGWERESVGFQLPYYDVNTFKHNPNAFQPGEPVVVTEKIHGSNARFIFANGRMYAGSRTLWKSPKSTCVWRKALQQLPWIEEWCRAHEGYALYGEVVPTQKGYRYGCETGQTNFFVFDFLTPDGEWVPWKESWPVTWGMMQGLHGHTVPMLYIGPFDREKIEALVDGRSEVDASHLREGIVIKSQVEKQIPGVGRLQLKIVSNAFYEKDTKD